ncbi:MAG TPA: DUF6263 family protein [Acidimicrobiales bacterium]|nr:DUF6263 family protein [Acidimicrobiales bacterium]
MRRRGPLTVLALTLALVAAVACGGSDDEAEPSATTQAESPAATEPGGAGARVTVEEAGSEPRERLRLRLTADSTTRAAMVSKTSLEMTMAGERLPGGTLPTTRTVIEQRIDRVDPDGTAHFTVKFTDWSVEPTPGADPDVSEQTERVLRQLSGLGGTGTISPSGVQTLTMDTSTVSDPTIKSLLDSMSSQIGNLTVPFPEEPVGPGARWRGTSSATISGITMNTTTNYTLRSRTGDRYELDVEQEAEAPAGRIDFPGLPPGAETSIERFGLESSGNVTGDLTKPLPATSNIRGGGEGRLTFSAEGEQGTVDQRVTLEIALSPA